MAHRSREMRRFENETLLVSRRSRRGGRLRVCRNRGALRERDAGRSWSTCFKKF